MAPRSAAKTTGTRWGCAWRLPGESKEGWQTAPHRFVSRLAAARFLGYLRAHKAAMTGSAGTHANRPELVAVHRYDTKYAMHALRLGLQGVELATTGRITLPVPEPDRDWVDSWLHRSYATFWNAGALNAGTEGLPRVLVFEHLACHPLSAARPMRPRPQRTCMLRELPVRRSSRAKGVREQNGSGEATTSGPSEVNGSEPRLLQRGEVLRRS
jgi:hypothetical protein